MSCSLNPLGHHFKTQATRKSLPTVSGGWSLILHCFGWPSEISHCAAWPCHKVSHYWTWVNGFVHLTAVIMDARKRKKALQLVCGAVSHWGHQITDRNHVEALAVIQGNAGVSRRAYINTMIVLESVELQQSWELSIAIRAGPKVGTPLLWIILIAFVLGVSRLNNKKKFEIMVSNFFVY